MKRLRILTVLLFGLITQKSNAQCTGLGNGVPAADYIGFNYGTNLNFATNAASQMTLTTNGDLNIIGGGNGYMIGGSYVLYTSGSASDIYVGVNAGNSGAANSTALGDNALHNNTAAANTAVGYYALYSNTGGGGGNTAVGAGALTANTTAQFNTALGWGALNANTAVRYNALFSKYLNTFIS